MNLIHWILSLMSQNRMNLSRLIPSHSNQTLKTLTLKSIRSLKNPIPSRLILSPMSRSRMNLSRLIPSHSNQTLTLKLIRSPKNSIPSRLIPNPMSRNRMNLIRLIPSHSNQTLKTLTLKLILSPKNSIPSLTHSSLTLTSPIRNSRRPLIRMKQLRRSRELRRRMQQGR
jgi:predicted RNA binding protein YcfA (HicA-like mRNA interferase family)